MSIRRHKLNPNAVPMPVAAVSPKAYADGLIEGGFSPQLEGPSGTYFINNDTKQIIWMSWVWDGVFWVETVVAGEEA